MPTKNNNETISQLKNENQWLKKELAKKEEQVKELKKEENKLEDLKISKETSYINGGKLKAENTHRNLET